MKCLGNEVNLGQCKHREWLTSNCHIGEAAGVICKPAATAETSTPTPTTEKPSVVTVQTTEVCVIALARAYFTAVFDFYILIMIGCYAHHDCVLFYLLGVMLKVALMLGKLL